MEKRKLEKPTMHELGLSSSIAHKRKLFNDAKTIVEAFLPIDTIEARREFEKDFKGYLLNELRHRTSAFSYGWNDNRICEFFSVNLDQLATIQHHYGQYRKLQWNKDFTEIVKPDNDIYTETEDELRRLELAEQLLEVCEKIKAEGYRVDMLPLSRAVSNAITPQGKVNIQFVKKQRL